MRITSALLRKHRACADQVDRFERLWPDGCDPTTENAAKALAAELEISWCTCLLSPAARARYRAETAPARERYHADIAAALVRAFASMGE